MKIAKTRAQLEDLLNSRRDIGFVPTMGALHQGHMSLIKQSKDCGLFTVASIFVNPTQFNDPKDYINYPIDTDKDLEKLEVQGCDLVFLPSREEVYGNRQNDARFIHDFGILETRLEGTYRPGHFKGVGQVVHIFLELVKPKAAFFGEKDFQQLQVIKELVKKERLPVEIIGLPTVREPDGLAMSSRNRRLSAQQRQESATLFKALTFAKERWGRNAIESIHKVVTELFEQSETLRLEYFDIINPETFNSLDEGSNSESAHAVIAAYAGDVRLIDNLRLD